MFSITKHSSFTLLCYTRANPYDNVSNVIYFFKRTIARIVQNPLYLPSGLPVNSHKIVRWDPKKDIRACFMVFEWMEAIKALYNLIFPFDDDLNSEEFRHYVFTLYGLNKSRVWAIILMRSHISALLSKAADANEALNRNSISKGDFTYVRNPIKYMKKLFSFRECANRTAPWNIPLENNSEYGIFREFFLSCWERAWLCPESFFTDNCRSAMFILQSLSERSNYSRIFYSIDYLTFIFFSFLIRFFSKYQISNALQTDIVCMFCNDIIHRLSIYSNPDLLVLLSESLLSLTGNVIAAASFQEWYNESSPVGLECIDLFSGEGVFCCSSTVEARVADLFYGDSLSMNNVVRRMLALYGPDGRTEVFVSIMPQSIEGMLEHSIIWREWYKAYRSMFVSFFDENVVIIYQTPCLSEISSKVITKCVFDNSNFREGATLLTGSIMPFFHSNRVMPTCLYAQCMNLEGEIKAIKKFHQERSLLTRFIFQLECFLRGPGVNDVDTLNPEKFYRKTFTNVLHMLPFSIRETTTLIECHAVCTWFLLHLFGKESFSTVSRDIILSAGPQGCAEALWKFILPYLQESEVGLNFDSLKSRFCKNFLFVYNSYFLHSV